MKRGIIAALAPVLAALLISCAHTGKPDDTPEGAQSARSSNALFETVCSADEALSLARDADAVIFETQGCTSGNEIWEAFYQEVLRKQPATVLCAHYYVLDRAHMSEELYESEKDQYPKLFFYLLAYDGKEFSVKIRESTLKALDYEAVFPYLLHFTGDAPPTARFSSYDYYVLVDDPSVT